MWPLKSTIILMNCERKTLTRLLMVLPGGALEVTDCLVVGGAVGDCLILVRIVGGAVVVAMALLLGVGVL